MNDDNQFFYFFNIETGEIFSSKEEAHKKKRSLYLIIDREKLFFNSFSVKAKKVLKYNDILNIQNHFIPFKTQLLNIIYSIDKKKEKKYFFWISPLTINIEDYFYDEVPESLIFKGNPGQIRNYNFFVFKRISGFEIIYFDEYDFYSLFEKDESKVDESVITLARKFSKGGKIKILSDIDIQNLNRDYEVDLIEDNKFYFLPDHFSFKKRFSNISKNKKVKNIKDMIKYWQRNLNIIIVILSLLIITNIFYFFILKKDNSSFKQRFVEISNIFDKSEQIEFELNIVKNKISLYPDHMLYLKRVCEALDIDSFLTSYSIGENNIVIEGYSKNSLMVLTKLRKCKNFKEVKFKTTVTKNIYSKKEKFEIEITTKKNK